MRKVILIGTKHSIQRDDISENEFELTIKELIKKFEIKAIGEEIDDKCVSVANKIATEEKISYKVIEPTPSEKENLKIEELHFIDYRIKEKYEELEDFPSNLINSGKEFDFKIRKEYISLIEDTYRQREQEWKKRIEQLNIYPILVICGSCHFKEFSKLLKESAFEVIEENERYGVDDVEFSKDCLKII